MKIGKDGIHLFLCYNFNGDRMYKYAILDFGKVLAFPATGEWFITPLFYKLVDMSKVKKEDILISISKHNDIISRKAETLEEEYQIFYDLYENIFKDIHYEVSNDIIHSLAHNFAYESDKYGFYDEIEKELEYLSKKYTLILLTDNWPSVLPIMRQRKLDKYFAKIYVSSIYNSKKEEGVFFDYPINDFKIKEGEAIFIDDNELLLDVALTKKLDVRLMDRVGNVNSNHIKIHSLFEL